MKKYFLYAFFAVCIISLNLSSAHSSDDCMFYSGPLYDKYKDMQYWGRVQLDIEDFDNDRKDIDNRYQFVQTLKLITLNRDKKNVFFLTSTDFNSSPVLQKHLLSEFKRLLQGKLPYHDWDAGFDERYKKAQAGVKERSNDFMDKFMIDEEARRNALYGTNPGGLFCSVRVQRDDTPVLFFVRCKIVANNDLSYIYEDSLQEEDIGFSSPTFIEKQLVTVLTEQMERLSGKFMKVKNCPKKTMRR